MYLKSGYVDQDLGLCPIKFLVLPDAACILKILKIGALSIYETFACGNPSNRQARSSSLVLPHSTLEPTGRGSPVSGRIRGPLVQDCCS